MVHGRHGNDEMHMHSECHLFALYSLRSEEVFLDQKVPEAIFVHGCHGNGMYIKIHFHALHDLQV